MQRNISQRFILDTAALYLEKNGGGNKDLCNVIKELL